MCSDRAGQECLCRRDRGLPADHAGAGGWCGKVQERLCAVKVRVRVCGCRRKCDEAVFLRVWMCVQCMTCACKRCLCGACVFSVLRLSACVGGLCLPLNAVGCQPTFRTMGCVPSVVHACFVVACRVVLWLGEILSVLRAHDDCLIAPGQ